MRTELAKRLTSDPEYAEFCSELRADIFAQFGLCKPGDVNKLQMIRLKLDALDAVFAKLSGLAQDFDASVRATKTTL